MRALKCSRLLKQKKYSRQLKTENQWSATFVSCTPPWTTPTFSSTIVVLMTVKISGWMSSSASKTVTTSAVATSSATVSACGLLNGGSS